MIKLDAIDKAILKYLQKDAKMNIKLIAAKINLTATPTYERIKRLEKNKIITSYAVVLDKNKINKSLEVFCKVKLSHHSIDSIKIFEKEIVKIKDVMECYHITGDADYLLKLVVSDINDYQDFIRNKLSKIENVSNVQSTFVMTNIKSNSIIEL